MRRPPLVSFTSPSSRTTCYIFEFGPLTKSLFANAGAFASRLDAFLRALPRGPRYSVEIRNPKFPHPECFAMLRAHNVAHVFNAWTLMPELHRQMDIDAAFTADFTMTRALTRFGASYEKTIDAYELYDRVQDPYPAAYGALRALIQRSVRERRPAFLFVNSRPEGNAPGTIRGLLVPRADGVLADDVRRRDQRALILSRLTGFFVVRRQQRSCCSCRAP
jgi:hypothetical protein